jgi:pimeloyl-ACP methyl ester carboxylesterase
MVLGFIDALDLGPVDVVGHDQRGAIAQVLAAEHAHRVNRLVLSNAEAYDNWPSAHERPYVKATQLPLLGRLAVWLGSRPRFLRWELASAGAVSDPAVLDAGLLQGYTSARTPAAPQGALGCDATLAYSSIRPTTAPRSSCSTGYGASSNPRCCCGGRPTPTSGRSGRSGSRATSPDPSNSDASRALGI